MDYLPELADNGQNWMNYGNSVLCAINDEGLMGFLVGSERRPTHPAELEGRGEGWTPQTDEERDEVAVWRTADQSWTRRNATVNYTIICGIPDTIFSSMLHLKSPLEKWDYLEKRFGSIPRPDSWLVVEEAMGRGNLLPRQDAAEETAHPHGDSDNEPANLPEGSSEALEPQEDPAESPDDHAKTKSGYLTPETEVVDAWQVDLHLPVLEVGSMDSEQPDEDANTFGAPDEGGQCMGDEVGESQDLPEPRSKALELECDATRPAGSHSIKSGTLPSFEEDQSTRMNGDEPILDIPDPPGTHIELSDPQVKPSILRNDLEVTGSTLGDPSEESDRSSQLRETERPGPHRDRTPERKFRIYEGRYTWDTPPDEVWGMGVHPPARVDMGDSRDVEPITTKLEIRPVSAKRARMRNALPRTPEPPPNAPTHTPMTIRDPRRRGRLKTRAENVSNTHTRRNACRARVVFVRPLLPLLAPSNRSLDPTGGLLTTNTGCREVRHARRDETRGGAYRTARVLTRLFLPFSTPSKRLRYPTGGLRMVNVRCNEVSSAREVQTRGYPYLDKHTKACVAIQPSRAPRKRLKPPWGVLRPYRRQGVPPEHTRSVDKPSLFQTAALQQRHKAEDSAQQDGASGGVLEIESPLCDVHFAAYSLSNNVESCESDGQFQTTPTNKENAHTTMPKQEVGMRSSDDGPTAKANRRSSDTPKQICGSIATILSRTSAYMPEQRNTYRHTHVTLFQVNLLDQHLKLPPPHKLAFEMAGRRRGLQWWRTAGHGKARVNRY
ncbi:hypothetical protein EDD15DRAFT_2522104 [Pisolithus albus]|nr:hypothetical protein EDD15DRAFT_2522104 [Pisolithus albus]